MRNFTALEKKIEEINLAGVEAITAADQVELQRLVTIATLTLTNDVYASNGVSIRANDGILKTARNLIELELKEKKVVAKPKTKVKEETKPKPKTKAKPKTEKK